MVLLWKSVVFVSLLVSLLVIIMAKHLILFKILRIYKIQTFPFSKINGDIMASSPWVWPSYTGTTLLQGWAAEWRLISLTHVASQGPILADGQDEVPHKQTQTVFLLILSYFPLWGLKNSSNVYLSVLRSKWWKNSENCLINPEEYQMDFSL